VDLLERPLADARAALGASGARFDVPAFGIASVAVKIKRVRGGGKA
jgi:hypothetical protein